MTLEESASQRNASPVAGGYVVPVSIDLILLDVRTNLIRYMYGRTNQSATLQHLMPVN